MKEQTTSPAANPQTKPAPPAETPSRRALWLREVEPSADPVDGSLLLDDLAAVLRQFVVLPAWAPETIALWVLHTYAFELRDVSAYLGIESPEKRCGKTTLLTVLGELVNRPVIAANISSPAFFRVIEEIQPTLLIDEADTLLHGNDELRGILNAGYGRQTAFVVRVAPENQNSVSEAASRLAQFSCWCPKAIAAIGQLPESLADRCILIRMQRKAPDEACGRLRDLAAGDLRRRCVRFVRDNTGRITADRPRMPAELNDRAADIWEPLLVLADLAGGPWPDRARQAAAAQAANAPESGPIGSLMLDLLVLFCNEGSGRLYSADMVAELNCISGRSWHELTRGRPLDERGLARLLRPYGVGPRSMRIGLTRGKGYFKEDFMEAFSRYIPRSELKDLIEEERARSEAAAQAEAEAKAADQVKTQTPAQPPERPAPPAPAGATSL